MKPKFTRKTRQSLRVFTRIYVKIRVKSRNVSEITRNYANKSVYPLARNYGKNNCT